MVYPRGGEVPRLPHHRGEDQTQQVVQALSVATIERLSAFFEANPINHDEPYKEIKAALLDSYKKTTSEDLQDLFDSMSLGDKRPSELLSEMTRRAGKDVSDRYLEPLWFSQCPCARKANMPTTFKTSVVSDRAPSSPQRKVQLPHKPLPCPRLLPLQ